MTYKTRVFDIEDVIGEIEIYVDEVSTTQKIVINQIFNSYSKFVYVDQISISRI